MLFLVPIRDYFATLRKREWLIEVVAPAAAAAGLGLQISLREASSGIQELRGAVINLLAIFVGFSITALTSLVSGANTNIDRAKKRNTEHRIGNQSVSFFQYVHLTLSYSIIAQLVLLLLNVVSVCAQVESQWPRTAWALVVLNSFLLLHVFAINLRNVAYIYFLFWAPDPSSR